MSEDTVHTGCVKFFNDAQGYGFLSAEGVDTFIHVSALDRV